MAFFYKQFCTLYSEHTLYRIREYTLYTSVCVHDFDACSVVVSGRQVARVAIPAIVSAGQLYSYHQLRINRPGDNILNQAPLRFSSDFWSAVMMNWQVSYFFKRQKQWKKLTAN